MRRITGWTSALCLAWGLVALGGPAGAVDITNDPNAQNIQNTQDTGSYGYLRTVESAATLIQAGSSDRTPAEVNQPVMVGDRIQVPDGSKAELLLPDHNLVRLDGGSDLVLEHLASSPDANDRATVLNLLEGNVQLVITEDSLGDELPRVDTPNTSVYPQDFGTYRIATTKEGWTEVTVRNGKAQVVTEQSSEDLGAGEQAVVEAEISVHEATGMDGLERWALRLDQDSEQAGLDDVNEDLRYAAAPLSRYGGWVTVENQRYWRPRVSDDWRPYTDGRWVYTPSGMTWVSTEPWGWVPYHYGSWDFVPGYGWLWQPGYVYSPAWVYWYWGPSYTGWCPMGYYTRFYATAGFGGFHAGLYGWAGGDWAVFSRWTFVPSSYWRGYQDGYRSGFRDGRGHWDQWDVRRNAVPIQELQRGGHPLERGLITTDTHRLRPDTWADPNRAVQVLRDSGGRPGRQGGELPDVSSFVARKPQLPPNVAQIVKAGPDDINRYVGTPLRPNTLGRGER
ncbi:MAG TPA: FecR family protein, partial [Thermoanaerobaculia bacterium]